MLCVCVAFHRSTFVPCLAAVARALCSRRFTTLLSPRGFRTRDTHPTPPRFLIPLWRHLKPCALCPCASSSQPQAYCTYEQRTNVNVIYSTRRNKQARKQAASRESRNRYRYSNTEVNLLNQYTHRLTAVCSLQSTASPIHFWEGLPRI
jgi:hypothetical protein